MDNYFPERNTLVMLWMILIFFSSWSFAQDFSFLLTPAAPPSQLALENMTSPQEELTNKEGETKVVHSRFIFGHTVKSEKLDYLIGGNYQHLDFDKNEVLRDYYQYQLSLGVRKQLPHNRFWFANVSYGTASDRPFKNSDDDTISANYIRKTSDKWFFVLNYSNNRSFLNDIPIPGFFYVKEAGKEKTTILGFPFIFVLRNVGNWSYRYFGLLPWRHQARVSYSKFPKTQPYVGYEQDVFNFFRHDRQEVNDRVFFFQRKIGLGIDLKFFKAAKVDLFMGHSFDREIFEAKNFSDKKSFRSRLANTVFIESKISYSF